MLSLLKQTRHAPRCRTRPPKNVQAAGNPGRPETAQGRGRPSSTPGDSTAALRETDRGRAPATGLRHRGPGARARAQSRPAPTAVPGAATCARRHRSDRPARCRPGGQTVALALSTERTLVARGGWLIGLPGPGCPGIGLPCLSARRLDCGRSRLPAGRAPVKAPAAGGADRHAGTGPAAGLESGEEFAGRSEVLHDHGRGPVASRSHAQRDLLACDILLPDRLPEPGDLPGIHVEERQLPPGRSARLHPARKDGSRESGTWEIQCPKKITSN